MTLVRIKKQTLNSKEITLLFLLLCNLTTFGQKDTTKPITFDILTSVTETKFKSKVSIYPNPASTSINVEVGAEKLANLELFNNLGQLLLRKELSGAITINTEEFESGLYYLRLETEHSKTTKKIIIE